MCCSSARTVSIALLACALFFFTLCLGSQAQSLSQSQSQSTSLSPSPLPFEAAALAPAATATPFGSKQLYRCRQSCYRQLARDFHYCTDFADCRNCWHACQEQLAPFELRVHAAQRQGALVLTDIGWDEAIANASRQCLITWEVSGGGLMGNLLTDTARAELSLWPDTVYNIQVTCKHKLSGMMRRSNKLHVDTRLLTASTTPTIPSSSTTTPSSPPVTLTGVRHQNRDRERDRDRDRVFVISALPAAAGQLGGVIYPAFGALGFFLALLVLFLFLRPQRKRLESDTEALLSSDDGAGQRRRLSSALDNVSSTLHV